MLDRRAFLAASAAAVAAPALAAIPAPNSVFLDGILADILSWRTRLPTGKGETIYWLNHNGIAHFFVREDKHLWKMAKSLLDHDRPS